MKCCRYRYVQILILFKFRTTVRYIHIEPDHITEITHLRQSNAQITDSVLELLQMTFAATYPQVCTSEKIQCVEQRILTHTTLPFTVFSPLAPPIHRRLPLQQHNQILKLLLHHLHRIQHISKLTIQIPNDIHHLPAFHLRLSNRLNSI
jgi:hypothetical protein